MDMERVVAGNLRAEFAHACRTMRSAWQQLLEVSVRAFGKSPKDKDVRMPHLLEFLGECLPSCAGITGAVHGDAGADARAASASQQRRRWRRLFKNGADVGRKMQVRASHCAVKTRRLYV